MTVGGTRLMKSSGSSCAEAVVDHQNTVATASSAAALFRRLNARSNRPRVRGASTSTA